MLSLDQIKQAEREWHVAKKDQRKMQKSCPHNNMKRTGTEWSDGTESCECTDCGLVFHASPLILDRVFGAGDSC